MLAVCASSMLVAFASTRIDHALIGAALENKASRRGMLEATLRTLDEHPAYVDEFFVAARRHPRTLQRFTEDEARELYAPDLAQPTATSLAQNPESLRVVLITTIDASRNRPSARAAIARAIDERAHVASSIIADRPSAVIATLRGTVDAAQSRPAARAAFLAGMRERSDAVARMINADPPTRNAMVGAMARATVNSLLHSPDRPPRRETVPRDRGKERARGGAARGTDSESPLRTILSMVADRPASERRLSLAAVTS